MSVAEYERTIPNIAGFNVSDLGEVSVSQEGYCTLVSALGTNFPEKAVNSYVVFVPERNVLSYKWILEKIDGIGQWVTATSTPFLETEYGRMRWRPNDSGLYKLIVEVYFDGFPQSDSIQIRHTVETQNEEFNRLSQKTPEKVTFLGNKEIARQVIFEFGKNGAFFEQGANKVGGVPSRRYLASLAYTANLIWSDSGYEPLRWCGIKERKTWVDGSMQPLDLPSFINKTISARRRLGLCRIEPIHAAVTLGLIDQPSKAAHWQKVRHKEYKNLAQSFDNLSPRTKQDLYNLLRFPKANIAMAATMLKRYLDAWPVNVAFPESPPDIPNNKTHSQLLATFFLFGGPNFTPYFIKQKRVRYSIWNFGRMVADNYGLPAFDVFLHSDNPKLSVYRKEWEDWSDKLEEPSTGKRIRSVPLSNPLRFKNGFTQYVFLRKRYVEKLAHQSGKYRDVPIKWLAENITDVPLTFLPDKIEVIPVHKALASLLLEVERNIKSSRLGEAFKVSQIGAFNPRMIGRGSFKDWRLSYHALGRGIDFDWTQNPQIFGKTMNWIEKLILFPEFHIHWSTATWDDLKATHRELPAYMDALVAELEERGLTHSQAVNALERAYSGFKKLLNAGKGFLAMPRELVDGMRRAGFEWGGDWKTQKDFMHFQYKGN